MNVASDAELMARIGDGDRSAFGDLVDRYKDPIVNYLTKMTGNRARAEEAAQEAFIKLWKSPPDAGEIAFPSWMRRVVTNLSITALQRTKRPQALPEFSTDRALRSGDRPVRCRTRVWVG